MGFTGKMFSDTKRIIIYGIVGILSALPIIAAMTFIPWSNHSTSYSLGLFNIDGAGVLDNSLVITNFTEPYGIGGEADAFVGVGSSCDLNVTVKLGLSPSFGQSSSCVEFADGGLLRIWQVGLRANVSKVFVERIKIVGMGFAAVWMNVDVDYESAPGIILQKIEDSWLIGAWEEGILITKEGPPGAPIAIAIGHPYLTELGGVSSEFNIYIDMIPDLYIQNVTAGIVLPEGLAFLNGTLTCNRGEQNLWSEELSENLTWSGDMEEDTWMRFEVRVKAAEVGNWTVIMSVGKCLPDGPWFDNATIYGRWWYGNVMVYGFQISEDTISSWTGDSSLNPYPQCFTYAKANVGDFKIVWPPIVLNITISDFTEPEGLDSEANLTVLVTANEDISNASMKIWLPEGVELVDGNLTWSGNLITNITIALSVRIRVIELGEWHVFIDVERCVLEDDGIWYVYPVFGTGFIIIVEENAVSVFPPSPIVSPPILHYP
jgi:hypothetical protein